MDYSFVEGLSPGSGDLMNRIFARRGFVSGWLGRPVPRAILLACICYLPQLLLAMADGVFDGSILGFRHDYAAIVQYLVTVPLLVLADAFVDPYIRGAIAQFDEAGIIPEGKEGEYRDLASRYARAARSRWVDLAAILLSLPIGWSWILPDLAAARADPSFTPWLAAGSGAGVRLSLAGIYAGAIANPLSWYLLIRWIWKAFVWVAFLYRVSRFELRIRPGHPDRAGGLGFLSTAQSAFGILIFALGCNVAATTAYNTTIEGTRLTDYANLVILAGFIVLAPSIFIAPLLAFTRRLYRAKREGTRVWGIYASRVAREVDERLAETLTADRRSGEGIGMVSGELGDAIGAAPDIREAMDTIRQMHVVPFDFISLGRLFLAAAGPLLPLILDSIPALDPAFKLLSGILGGGE
ncbi:MAG: hypothetical protein NT080_04895 [Spirochaetes bacterium]|nr:hypothetical protein [Spirochaetota bacterium]